MIERNSVPLSVKFKRINSFQTSFLRTVFAGVLLVAVTLQAQPAKGANKFLGNITTKGAVRSDFLKYWNQITGENECKWGSVEGTRDRMNWGGADAIAKFAKQNGIPWKFHTLVWGGQSPSWMNSLSEADQLAEVTEWFDSAAARFPDVQMIDVVNEGHPNHAPAPYRACLGGNGTTGYDWIIKSFEMARARWPKAILIYNDYNNIEYNGEVTWTVGLINAMKTAKAPIDAIGCQAHDAYKIATATVKSNIDKLAATGLPIFITEYDIGYTDDAQQEKSIKDQFTMFWNHPKIVGVTYWGYVVGSTWRTGTGLLNTNGTERPSLTWLVDFVTKTPNPPNEYPNLINLGTGTINGNLPFASPYQHTTIGNGPGLMKLYDLQGRVAGSYYVNNRTVPVSSMMPSQKTYVIQINGKSAGSVNKVR